MPSAGRSPALLCEYPCPKHKCGWSRIPCTGYDTSFTCSNLAGHLHFHRFGVPTRPATITCTLRSASHTSSTGTWAREVLLVRSLSRSSFLCPGANSSGSRSRSVFSFPMNCSCTRGDDDQRFLIIDFSINIAETSRSSEEPRKQAVQRCSVARAHSLHAMLLVLSCISRYPIPEKTDSAVCHGSLVP